jgi:sugar lactone lactonase YvrE
LPNSGSSPTEVTVGNDGNLWFSESQNSKIGRITPTGTITEFPTTTGNSVPEGMTLGPDCNVWFTETNANLIGRIDKTGAITEFTIPTANSQPVGITLGPDGNLWFAESAANQIAKLVPPAGSSTDCATVTLPPVAKCQNAKVNTDAGACTASSASIDDGSFDPQNRALTETTAPNGPYNLGTTPATLTVRRSPVVAAACAAQIEVDDNEAPKLTCPGAVVEECTSPAGATASLTPTATDNCPNLGAAQCTGSGGTFALGTTSVNCSVTDGSHNTSSCTTSVTVKDTIAPVISSVSASPAVLWPPDHKMIPVTVSVAVTDTCDTSVASRCKIVSVSSNQHCDRSALKITGPLTVLLEADRDDDGARGYTIQVQCADASGNTATGSVTVSVPHDQGHGDERDHDDDHGDDARQRVLRR